MPKGTGSPLGSQPLPPMPLIPLDSAQAVGAVAQQLGIGFSLGFAVRVIFAAVEFAGHRADP